jgi:hypothetical protein
MADGLRGVADMTRQCGSKLSGLDGSWCALGCTREPCGLRPGNNEAVTAEALLVVAWTRGTASRAAKKFHA